MNYVLDQLDDRSRLPVRNDANVLTTEEDLLRQRFRRFVQYIMEGGNPPEEGPTPEHEAAGDEIRAKLKGTLLFKSV